VLGHIYFFLSGPTHSSIAIALHELLKPL
jgi:hypothetical protein